MRLTAKEKRDRRNEYMRARRKKLKDQLLALIGKSCCKKCGSKENLTIEHEEGRDYQVRKLSSDQRLMVYIREFQSGVKLSVLCLVCNSAGGNYWSAFYAEQAQDKSTGQAFIPPALEPRDLEPPF